MERWWFHMIAGPDGNEAQMRLVLRVGDDESSYPKLQVAFDGTDVPLDDAEVDYEAPEWKAKELYAAGGGGGADAFEDLKERLREQLK